MKKQDSFELIYFYEASITTKSAMNKCMGEGDKLYNLINF